MITDFNKYKLILEKSSLSSIIDDNEFINEFHKWFGDYVSDKLEFEEIQDNKFNRTRTDSSIVKYFNFFSNLKIFSNGMLTYNNIFLFITKEHTYVFYYQNHEYIILHYSKTKKLSILDTSRKDTDMINKMESIVDHTINVKIYNIKDGVHLSKNLYFDKETESTRIAYLFVYRYKDSFDKYVKNLISIYNVRVIMLKVEISYFNNDNKYLALKLTKLYNDINELSKFIDVYFDKKNIGILNNLLTHIDTMSKNLNINHIKKVDIDYENYLLLKLKNMLLISLINKLSYKKQYLANIEIEKNPSIYSTFKDDLYDKEMLDKWEHLDDANNFDLI